MATVDVGCRGRNRTDMIQLMRLMSYQYSTLPLARFLGQIFEKVQSAGVAPAILSTAYTPHKEKESGVYSERNIMIGTPVSRVCCARKRKGVQDRRNRDAYETAPSSVNGRLY